ncbi:hypothetical protein [Saccharicrinis aurantiacus]|uniref:hypothetical protein n=1 Tax=Saccharicrinis aurantiacus TaxID=1849719 RepID=UPI000838582D|nr:hypothetical protein [Saccharicrinis aurantiacus]
MNELKSCEDWINELDQKVEKMPRIQSRLANFEMLPRLGELLEAKKDSCPDCRNYWSKLQESTIAFEEFFDDGNDHLVEFENVVDETMQHLKSTHGIRPKGLVLSYKTVVLMVVGLFLGFLLGLIEPQLMKTGVVMGWLLGTLSGWFWGKSVEKQMKKNGLIF